MENALFLLAVGLATGLMVPCLRRIRKEYRMNQEAKARLNAWVPARHAIPLPHGVIHPSIRWRLILGSGIPP